MYRSPILGKAVIPALAVLSLAYAVYATGVMRPKAVEMPPLGDPPVRAFARAVGAVGIVEPASELVALAPRVAGWIDGVYVVAGQRVAKGEKLFSLDCTDLRAELTLRTEAVAVAEARLARLRAFPRAEDVPIAQGAVDEAKARLTDAENNLRFVESVVDKRAIPDEEVSHRRQAVARERAALAMRQGELDRLLAGAWKEDLLVAESELRQARASAARTEADIERMTTRAPMDAVVLRSTARMGQYAPAGVMEEPLITLGSQGPLHVRADINEQDVPKVRAGASAVAMLRGDATTQHRMEFVRFEPLVVPKKALSGFAQERVDTRVLQAIFRVTEGDEAMFVGQQVDIYIDAGASTGGTAPTGGR